MPREDKQRWLESVDLARKVKNYDNAPTPTSPGSHEKLHAALAQLILL
jgi:hypothetical protein